MPLSKLNVNARVSDQVYEALHSAIVSGEYEQGQRMQIRDLAEELGVSVMPVREAIKRLEEVGLVETEAYRGAVVKRLTSLELLQIYNVRKILEVEAVRLGSANITEETLDDIVGKVEELIECYRKGEIVKFLDKDEAILTAIYSAARNDVLLDMIQSLWYRCRSYKIVGARKAFDSGEKFGLVDYQESLIAALSAGDGEAAAKITEDSLNAAIGRIHQGIVDEFEQSAE